MQPDPLLKICGITNVADGQRALELGVTVLGINAWPGSKRFLPPQENASWVRELNAQARHGVIFVLVNPGLDELLELWQTGLATQLQLHGEETPEFVARLQDLQIPVIKALRVRGPEDLSLLPQFPNSTFLLDAWHPGERGGTGTTFDWQLARQAVHEHPGKKIILSGGLNPENISQAIEKVAPAGVDVASGVENPGNPRQKSAQKMADFLRAAQKSYLIAR